MSASRSDTTILGTGRSLDPGERMTLREIGIPNAWRSSHMCWFGTTQSGKTAQAQMIMEQDIRSGRSVIFIDPKNDQAAAARIVQTAFAVGRQEELMFINTAFPEHSVPVNPMSHWFIPEELVAHCVAGIKEGREPFYRNVGKELTSAVIAALQILAGAGGGQRLQLNLNDIKRRMSREELISLKEELRGIMTPEAGEIEEDLERIIETGPDYYAKVASSLRCALMELTTGNVGKIVGKANDNRFLKRLENGRPVIFVCQLGSMIVEEAALTLGKVILSMIQKFIGRAYISKKKKASPPICLHIDEAQSVLPPSAVELFSKAGSADCWITAYAQSINDFYTTLGKDLAHSILSNTNTKGFLRVSDPETAQYVCRHFGTHKILSPLINVYGGVTSREVEEDIVKPNDVITQRPRSFYLLTYPEKGVGSSGSYRGKTNDLSPGSLEIEFPDAPSA